MAFGQLTLGSLGLGVTGSGGGQTLWTPLDLGATLVAWWDAQDTANITQSGGRVSNWTDRKSGIAASQSTAGIRPTYEASPSNGYPSLGFDGGSFVLTFTPTLLPSGNAASTIAVAAYSFTAGQKVAFAWGDNTAEGMRSVANDPSNFIAAYGNGTNNQSTTTAWASRDRFVEVLTPSGATPTQSIYADGTLSVSGAVGTFATGSTFGLIGSWIGSSLYWSGYIQQIVVCNAVLTDSQRQKLKGWESWWDGKAGSNLPGGHPYKLRPPYVTG